MLELLLVAGAFGLGGLPLTGWLVRLGTGKDLRALGTGNVGVSAAFTQAGTFVGILAVLAEALRGVVGVLTARALVPGSPALEVLTLVALVGGRFWIARGAGITNAFWGLLVHAPAPTGCLALVMLLVWIATRARRFTQTVTLLLMPLVFYLFEPDWMIGAVIALAGLLGWTLNQTADDLDLSADQAGTTRRFLGGRLKTLDEPLTSQSAGGKAANLSHLRRAGFAVPQGWVLLPGNRPGALLTRHKPTEREPWVVRSSATTEDGLQDSAAGQYKSVLGITDSQGFYRAVEQVRDSWDAPAASAYRQSRASASGAMAVLVQLQVQGIYSGVLFTRDPVEGSERLVVEAVRGGAERVVSGQETPECLSIERNSRVVHGDNTLPLSVIEQLHDLGLAVERFFGGLPQDIEWTWDGERLWLLQARPITNLRPVWTRTIAAEVIPGVIRPLTWSINRPLTCGVWGEIFTIVLGKRATDIDFNQTATLIEGWAYFNATLLGTIFRRMGLPESSLEFLLTGARFSRPSPLSLVRNLPGLLRLLGHDLRLVRRFAGETSDSLLAELEQTPADTLSPRQLLERVAEIQAGLRVVTYYNILAPLGFAVRKALLRVPEDWLSEASTAEVASVRQLRSLADRAYQVVGPLDTDQVLSALATSPEGKEVLTQLDAFLERYGYLSEVGTDIAVPTWREHPETIHHLFAALVHQPPRPSTPFPPPRNAWDRYRKDVCMGRARLRGQVAEVYERLLANLRWTFIALEVHARNRGQLHNVGDIFFLELPEVQALVTGVRIDQAFQEVDRRKYAFHQQRQQNPPPVVYGTQLPRVQPLSTPGPGKRLKGIAASRGLAVGRVRTLRSLSELQSIADLGSDFVLVVPYTDAGWTPLLMQARAIVCEVGGKLSHGAIIAREYNLPAVMNVTGATQLLQDGQRVRVDGGLGTVEILEG